MLQILVLGPPAILLDDKPLDIQRRQLRTLLYYLACQPDGVGRGELLTRFWPDAKESDARRQLREILSKLRTQLPSPEDLQTDHDRIWLNKQTVYSDIQTFLSLVQPAQSIFDSSRGKTTLPENLVEMLEKAVSLWRSPSFLAGVRISNTHEFDDWMQEKASTLEYYRLQTLERLADHYSSIGVLDKAILNVHKALESDTLNDVLQAQLLSLLYSAGRVSEAQTYYSYLMELYQREYDDAPPDILRNTMDEVARIPLEEKTHQPVYGNTSKNTRQIFVGRVKELKFLESEYERKGIVLINGEIGSGKTLFVNHFYSSLKDKPRLFFITCHSQEANLPLQPIINLIRDYVTREDWDNLDQRWVKSLSVLVPDIPRKTSSTQPLKDWSSREARLELFEAIHQLFVAVSRNSQILLIVDDIHWCDIDSLEVLMYLSAHKFFENRGFVILVSRTEIQNLRIRDLLNSDKNRVNIPRITLGALMRSEIIELAGLILGQVPTEDFIQNLHKATGGNPSFIVETLNALMGSSSSAAVFQQDDIPLAESLSAIIMEKERNLSESAREVLSAAAMCGMEFQYDILKRMNFCDSDVLVQCLEELEEKRYIQPGNISGSIGQYSFIHSLIRDSIISRLSQARQCLWHEKIANVMSAHKGSFNNRNASIIARHYEAAGKPVHAFQYWVKAGQYARGLFSIDGAYTAFEKANAIRLDYGQSIPEEDLYELFFEWGDLAYNVMDVSTLNECYSAMYEAGEKNNDPLLIGAGLSGMALSAIFTIDLNRASILLEQSIRILNETDNLFEKIQARCRLGITLSMGLQNDKGVEAYLQAIDLGKGLPGQIVRQAVTYVQYLLSVQYCLMGWPEKAKATGKQGLLNAYLLISKPSAQSNVHMALALAAYYSGNFSEANDHIKHCLKINESLLNLRTTSLVQILQARINGHTGRLDIAWKQAKNALKTSMENGYFENISEALCIRGDIYLLIQDFPKAIREYSLGCEQLPGSFQGMNCYYRLGYATVRNGDFKKGMDILEKAISDSTQAGFGSISLPARHLKAIILKEMGKLEEARNLYDEVKQEASACGLSLIVFPESIEQADLICASVDNSQAEIIISNLMQDSGILPGPWLDFFIQKMSNNPDVGRHFNKNRFIQFLESIKQQNPQENTGN